MQELRLRGSDYTRGAGRSTARKRPTTQAGNSARTEARRKKEQEKKGENTTKNEPTTQARKDTRRGKREVISAEKWANKHNEK